MTRNVSGRVVHRWIAIAFTLTIVANLIALGAGEVPAWITYSPFLPLGLLMATGLYMLAVQYARAWRTAAPRVAHKGEQA
jgi:hypothetical protein